jgi:hypothetical protein
MVSLKKSSTFLMIIVGAMMSCDENNNIAPDNLPGDQSTGLKSSQTNASLLSGCTPNHGSGVYLKENDYNCHQYVRAALLEGKVNLTTGEPSTGNFTGYDNYSIQSDSRFIRVCNASDASAVAIAHLPGGMDHSALKLPVEYAYSYPGSQKVYKGGSALHYTTACDYEYFAAIPSVYVSGPVQVWNGYKFTLENKSLYPFLIADNTRWSISDPAKFTEVSETDTEYIIAPIGCASGTYTVIAKIHSNATKTGSACTYGVNGIEPATTFVPTKTNAFSIPIDCSGTLDGGSLNTVNFVSRGTHQVVMKICPLTWVKTSGTATWSTSNSGKNMTFTINGGSVSFNVYGLGCNRNVTFYSN